MTTQSRIVRASLAGLLLSVVRLSAGHADTLAQNRDRLFRAWCARSVVDYHTQTWHNEGGFLALCTHMVIDNPGVMHPPRTDVCLASHSLSVAEKLVFLTITHRLSLGVLNQPNGWSLEKLGYTPCLKD